MSEVALLVKDLIVAATTAGHQHEQLEFEFSKRIILSSRYLTGVLAMVIGAANHGQKWPDDIVRFLHKIPEDPAGLDWAGPPKHKGKHWLDGGRKGYMKGSRPMGGVGIQHRDGRGKVDDDLRDGNLERFYAKWGQPDGIPYKHLSKSFDQLIDYGNRKYREAWLDYITPKLDDLEVQVWMVTEWLEKYWRPAIDTFASLSDCSVNSRIGNSVSGVARELREGNICICTGDPDEDKYKWKSLGRLPTVTEQIETYYSYKLAKRGESSAERALRQANQALRVGEIIDVVGFTAL